MSGNVVTFSGFVQRHKPSRCSRRVYWSAARARTVNHQFTCLRAGPHCCVVTGRRSSRLRQSAERAGGSTTAGACALARPALLRARSAEVPAQWGVGLRRGCASLATMRHNLAVYPDAREASHLRFAFVVARR